MEVTSAHRRCATKGCVNDAETRRGPRGPQPRRCTACRVERKREINHRPVKSRTNRPPCCDDGHLCPQHEQFRDEIRIPVLPVSRQEASWLVEQLGTADGFHITGPANPRGWHSYRGPDEGRTRPEIFHADPYGDDGAVSWLDDNNGWHSEKSIQD